MMLRICKLNCLSILAFVFLLLVHTVATMFLSLQNWLSILFKIYFRE